MKISCISFAILLQLVSCLQTSRNIFFSSHILKALPNFDDVRTSLDDFDHILQSIAIFKNVYKDVRIPLKFEVPAESPWPFELHGLRLGKRLEKILSSSEFFEQNKDKVRQLEILGFTPEIGGLLLNRKLL